MCLPAFYPKSGTRKSATRTLISFSSAILGTCYNFNAGTANSDGKSPTSPAGGRWTNIGDKGPYCEPCRPVRGGAGYNENVTAKTSRNQRRRGIVERGRTIGTVSGYWTRPKIISGRRYGGLTLNKGTTTANKRGVKNQRIGFLRPLPPPKIKGTRNTGP